MATETLSFGTMLSFYRSVLHQVKQAVASYFGMPDKVFDSWLHALNAVRNVCAHHGRLWNRVLGVKPLMPFKKIILIGIEPNQVENNKFYAIYRICSHCLKCVALQSHWEERVNELLKVNDYAYIANMGFLTINHFEK